MADENGTITAENNAPAPAAAPAPAQPAPAAPAPAPVITPIAAPATPVHPNDGGGRTGAPSYLNTPEPVVPAPAPDAPAAADPTPSDAPAAALEATPAAVPGTTYQVPDSLTGFVDAAPSPAPAAPEAPAATDKVAVIGNYKNDAARAISAYLGGGGDIEDIQVYQQAETLQAMGDTDLAARHLADRYGVSTQEAKDHLVNQYGETVKDGEGKETKAAKGLAYKIQVENFAKEARDRVAGIVEKINGAAAAAPTTEGAPATELPAGQVEQAQGPAASAPDQQAASQAARDLLSTNPTFAFPIKYGDGSEETVKLGIPPEFTDAAQQVLAASVMQARSAMKDRSPASIQQYHQDVQTAHARVVRLFNDEGYQTVAAAADQRGYERAKLEFSNVTGNNIYGSRGESPSGNGTTLTPRQQAMRKAKHADASLR